MFTSLGLSSGTLCPVTEGLLNVGKTELNYNDKILSFAVSNCKPILKITGSTEWG